MRAFRDGSPYGNEDLFLCEHAQYQRALHPATPRPPACGLSERRVEGADLTFRFPRSWLGQWRAVADAMDRLTRQLRGPKG